VAYAISDGIARATRAESRARGMVSRGVNTFSGGLYMCRLLGLTRQPWRSSPEYSPGISAGRGHGVITPKRRPEADFTMETGNSLGGRSR